jgi:hypothetical protein
VNHNLPGQQLENLKTFLYTYIVMAPLLSALFAEHIDSWFFACVLFVALVGGAFSWVRSRLDELEQSLRDQERNWMNSLHISIQNDEALCSQFGKLSLAPVYPS